MKKINHVAGLYKEQLRLLQRQSELEKLIRQDWKGLQETVRARGAARKILSELINDAWRDKIQSKGVLSGSLSYGAAMLTEKLIEKASEKLQADHGR
jgi:hypothetical protein